ncbi:MAG: DUF5615 family PIN-like protein [Pirellulales bacterium]|nr:DUF5615 family PIN-like protein [Pirellulales bacterium]
MRFLLDQGLPRSAVEPLRAAGFDAEHVGELGMHAAPDTAIMAAAVDRDAVVVSLDSDFHALLAASGASGPSVIRVRIEGLRGPELAELIKTTAAATGDELEAGAVVTVTERQIRVRSLPIGKKPR